MESLELTKSGRWLPAIPEPYYFLFFKKCTETGRVFLTKKGYQKHYVNSVIYEL